MQVISIVLENERRQCHNPSGQETDQEHRESVDLGSVVYQPVCGRDRHCECDGEEQENAGQKLPAETLGILMIRSAGRLNQTPLRGSGFHPDCIRRGLRSDGSRLHNPS